MPKLPAQDSQGMLAARKDCQAIFVKYRLNTIDALSVMLELYLTTSIRAGMAKNQLITQIEKVYDFIVKQHES